MRLSGFLRGHRGQGLVEFALVSPVLLMAIFGIMDLVRVVWEYDTLAHASSEGSRYAAIHGHNAAVPSGPGALSYTAPNLDSNVTAFVRGKAVGLDPNTVVVQSTWPDGDNLRGSRVLVEVTYAFRPLAVTLLGVGTITMRSASEARIVY